MAVRYSWPVDILVSVTEPPSPQRRGLRYPETGARSSPMTPEQRHRAGSSTCSSQSHM